MISVKKIQVNWKGWQATFSFRIFALIRCTIGGLFSRCRIIFIAGKNRLDTVCTQQWKTCAGLAPRRWKNRLMSIARFPNSNPVFTQGRSTTKSLRIPLLRVKWEHGIWWIWWEANCENYSTGEPRVSIFLPSQHVIGSMRHIESILLGFFKQKQTSKERKWLLFSADFRGAGTRDKPLRTSAWEGRTEWSPWNEKVSSHALPIPSFSIKENQEPMQGLDIRTAAVTRTLGTRLDIFFLNYL